MISHPKTPLPTSSGSSLQQGKASTESSWTRFLINLVVISIRILRSASEYCDQHQTIEISINILWSSSEYWDQHQNVVISIKILRSSSEYWDQQENIVISIRILRSASEYWDQQENISISMTILDDDDHNVDLCRRSLIDPGRWRAPARSSWSPFFIHNSQTSKCPKNPSNWTQSLGSQMFFSRFHGCCLWKGILE